MLGGPAQGDPGPTCTLPSGAPCSWVQAPVHVEGMTVGVAAVAAAPDRALSTLLVRGAPDPLVLLREGDHVAGRGVAPILGVVPGRDEGGLVLTVSGAYRLWGDGSLTPVLVSGDLLDDATRFVRLLRVLRSDPTGWVIAIETSSGTALHRVEGARTTPLLRAKQIVPEVGVIESVEVTSLQSGPQGSLVFTARTVGEREVVLTFTNGDLQLLGTGSIDDTRVATGSRRLAGDATGGWSRYPLDVDECGSDGSSSCTVRAAVLDLIEFGQVPGFPEPLDTRLGVTGDNLIFQQQIEITTSSGMTTIGLDP